MEDMDNCNCTNCRMARMEKRVVVLEKALKDSGVNLSLSASPLKELS